jgi:hypothetical protein
MATPNIVPRAAGEGGLGTAAKGWGGAFVTNKTTSSATEGGKLVLAANDGAVMASGHRLGVIEFKGAEDGSGTLTNGARIQCVADSSTTWSGTENDAWLEFYTTDANASESKVLTLTHLKTAHFTGVAYFESSVDVTSNIVVDGTGTFSGAGGVTINDATTSSATEGGHLTLIADDGAALADGHRLGVIEFKGAEDGSSTLATGARIECVTENGAWSGANNAANLNFYTASSNGTGQLALSINGYSNSDATFRGDVICNEVRATQVTTTNFSNTKGMFLDCDTSGVGAQDATGMHIDFDRAVAGSGTAAHNDIGLNLDVTSASLGTSTLTGIDLDVVGTAAGTSTAIGINLDVDTADTNIGMIINTAGTHMKLVANADVNDYATFTLADTGDLTIETVGSGTTDSDMTFTVDGNIALNAGTTSVNSTSIPLRKFAPTGSSTNGAYSGGDVVYFGGTTSMTAGAIYHYKSDGTWELADADAVATSDGLLGVALGAASDTNGMLLRGMVTIDHDPGAIGDVLFLSTTAGDCSATAPSGSADIVRVIGYQVNHASNGEIWFCPDGTYVELA